MILDLLRKGGSIVVNKKLAHAIGMDAAVMYAELISKQRYFAKKGQLTDDGFYFNLSTSLKKTRHYQNRGLPQKFILKLMRIKPLL